MTSQIDDRAILRSLEQEGEIGPPVRLVRSRGRTLEAAAKVAAERLRSWYWKGYDVDAVTITARLARDDRFEVVPKVRRDAK